MSTLEVWLSSTTPTLFPEVALVKVTGDFLVAKANGGDGDGSLYVSFFDDADRPSLEIFLLSWFHEIIYS